MIGGRAKPRFAASGVGCSFCEVPSTILSASAKPSLALCAAASEMVREGFCKGVSFFNVDRNHDRAAFSSGSPPLDQFLKTQARQAIEENLAAVFILTFDA